LHLLGVFGPTPESLRTHAAQVGVIGDPDGAVSGPFAQPALQLRLQLPGNAPEQILFVRRPGLCTENLAILRLQRRHRKTAQLLNPLN
jgi:hypothetical protein